MIEVTENAIERHAQRVVQVLREMGCPNTDQITLTLGHPNGANTQFVYKPNGEAVIPSFIMGNTKEQAYYALRGALFALTFAQEYQKS